MKCPLGFQQNYDYVFTIGYFLNNVFTIGYSDDNISKFGYFREKWCSAWEYQSNDSAHCQEEVTLSLTKMTDSVCNGYI